ncbi:hypothetical protein BB560_004791 [Smittium megazygosporum]|uniref:Uncharacterized protein n=1 Tax=Smittium megazygosporum TaxID=133381 RepID=A0A2T9Z8G0_9FUNG|nr:hypothetical protein BB560_004791 [Smittium megazygosporum]
MDVTKDNFKSALSTFETHLKDARFVSIDVEMTGKPMVRKHAVFFALSIPIILPLFFSFYFQLYYFIQNLLFSFLHLGLWLDERSKGFSFDSFQTKYEKIKLAAENFQIIQVGVSLFEWIPNNSDSSDKDSENSSSERACSLDHIDSSLPFKDISSKNKRKKRKILNSSRKQKHNIDKKTNSVSSSGYYETRVYNFFIYPALKSGPFKKEKNFMLINSSVDFLTENAFDFNKWIYQGIPYLNFSDLEKLKKEKLSFITNPRLHARISDDSKDFYESTKLKIDGLANAPEQTEIFIDAENTYKMRLIHQIVDDIPCLYSVGQPGSVKIIKTNQVTKKKLIEEYITKLEKDLEKHKGFSKVIELLSECNKPIIGHNCFTDFVYLYSHFCRPLPNTLAEFKNEIHNLFPEIYDTKFIFENSLCLKSIAVSSTLEDLNKSLKQSKGFDTSILLNARSSKYTSDRFHEAGFDSFLTGKLFIKALPNLADSLNGFLNKLFMFKSFPSFVHITEADDETNRPLAIELCSSQEINLKFVQDIVSEVCSQDEYFIYTVSLNLCYVCTKIPSHDTINKIYLQLVKNGDKDWSVSQHDQ